MGEASKCRWLSRTVTALFTAAYVGSLPVAARALVCGGVRVQVGTAGAPWRSTFDALCELLGTLPDLDRTARLVLGATEAEVHVGVTLAPPSPSEPPPTAAAPVAAPTYLTLGVALYADMRLNAWLLGLNVRWDGFETLAKAAPPGFEMESVGVGFHLVNELLREHASALPLGATTELLATTQALEKLERETDRSAATVRVGVLARVLLGSSPLRSSVTLEPELSPMRLGKSLTLYSPLPTWSVGLGVGAAWEVR